MDLKNEEGRKIKQKSKKGNSEEEEPKGRFQARRLPVLGSAVAVSTAGGSLVPSLAGELSLAGEFSLAGERSLAGDSSLGGVVEADGTSGAASGPSW